MRNVRCTWQWPKTPRHRSPVVRGFRPDLLDLERRALLSTATTMEPTPYEQYMLELINQARANPAAEGQRLLALVQSDPYLQMAVQYEHEDLNQFIQVISSYAPEPPLAFNTSLIAAATDHSQAMLAANMQYHSPADYLTNPQDNPAGNGQAFYPVGTGGWSTGENIFAYSSGVGGTDPTPYVDYFNAAFFLDWGNPDFGHLKNLLAPGPGEANFSAGLYPYSEIGIGLLTNVTPTVPPGTNNSVAANQGINVGPDIVTQEFGWRQGNAFLTGSVFTDNAHTGFYLPGEGVGNVVITATGTGGQGTFQTQTWGSGGYSLQLPPGTYQVMATGNLPSPVSAVVTIGQDNVLWEVPLTGQTTTPPQQSSTPSQTPQTQPASPTITATTTTATTTTNPSTSVVVVRGKHAHEKIKVHQIHPRAPKHANALNLHRRVADVVRHTSVRPHGEVH